MGHVYDERHDETKKRMQENNRNAKKVFFIQRSFLLRASEQINRGFERAKTGELYRVEFMGKTTNSKGQPVNRFRVDIIEEL